MYIGILKRDTETVSLFLLLGQCNAVDAVYGLNVNIYIEREKGVDNYTYKMYNNAKQGACLRGWNKNKSERGEKNGKGQFVL